jgi:hypothetical protein
MRRIKQIALSQELVIELLTNGVFSDFNERLSTEEGLPEGALFAGSTYDVQSATAYLFFVHESFDEIPYGAVVPQITPVVRRETK